MIRPAPEGERGGKLLSIGLLSKCSISSVTKYPPMPAFCFNTNTGIISQKSIP